MQAQGVVCTCSVRRRKKPSILSGCGVILRDSDVCLICCGVLAVATLEIPTAERCGRVRHSTLRCNSPNGLCAERCCRGAEDQRSRDRPRAVNYIDKPKRDLIRPIDLCGRGRLLSPASGDDDARHGDPRLERYLHSPLRPSCRAEHRADKLPLSVGWPSSAAVRAFLHVDIDVAVRRGRADAG